MAYDRRGGDLGAHAVRRPSTRDRALGRGGDRLVVFEAAARPVELLVELTERDVGCLDCPPGRLGVVGLLAARDRQLSSTATEGLADGLTGAFDKGSRRPVL